MKKVISLLLATVLALSVFTACGGNESGKTERPSPYIGKSAAFVGDSITYGIGLETQSNQYWVQVKDALQFGATHGMGVSGSCVSTKSARGYERSPLALRYESIPKVDMIFIFMGTNDFGGNVPMGKISDNSDISYYGAWNMILTKLKDKYPETKIILMTSVPRYSLTENKLGLKLDDYVAALKEIAEHHELPVMDLYTLTADIFTEDAIEELMPDKIHPNEEGHRLLAETVKKWLEDNQDTIFPE